MVLLRDIIVMQRRTYDQGHLVYLQPPQSDHGVLVSNVGVLWQWQRHVNERNPWLNFWGLRPKQRDCKEEDYSREGCNKDKTQRINQGGDVN